MAYDRKKIEHIKKSAPVCRADFVVFALIIVFIVLSFGLVFCEKGEFVEIKSPNGVFVYDLNADREIDVDGHLTVVIKNGEVFVRESDCSNQDCVHMGKISRANQIIACLPNGIIIRIKGKGGGLAVVTG